MEKLKSRKFWITLLSVATGIASLFGASDGAVQAASSIGLILVPAVVYVVTEGRIDAAALQTIDFEALFNKLKELLDKSKDE